MSIDEGIQETQEEDMYQKEKIDLIVKQVKIGRQKRDTDVYPHKAKDSTDTISTVDL